MLIKFWFVKFLHPDHASSSMQVMFVLLMILSVMPVLRLNF